MTLLHIDLELPGLMELHIRSSWFGLCLSELFRQNECHPNSITFVNHNYWHCHVHLGG